MRIVLVSRIFTPEPGAASLRLRAFANEAARRGQEVTVITSMAPEGYHSEDAGVDARVRVQRAPVLRDSSGYVRGYLQYLSFDLPLFLRLLRIPRPDVLLVEPPPTTGAVARIVCAIRRLPYVYYAADIWSDASATAGAPRVVVRAVRSLERFSVRGASSVVSVSHGVTKRLRELGIANRVATVGNGIDLSDFTVVGDSEDIGAPYLLYAGTASEVHGARIFADAFEEVHKGLPEAVLVFIGQGSERAEIEEVASRLPRGSLRFIARQEPREVARWLRGARAALASVKPGAGYDFAFPTKLYAAAACGTPTIYAGEGPGRDFVSGLEEGQAVAYQKEDVVAAMERALVTAPDPVARKRTAEWARTHVGIEAVAKNVLTTVADIGS